MIYILRSGYGFFKILRPVNSTAAGLAAIIGCLIATGTIVFNDIFVFFVVFFITGAGNVINDYFDSEIDKINRPDRPIPSGKVTAKSAFFYSLFLFATGVLLSFLLGPLCAGLALINSILLLIYSKWLKATVFLGNVTVAYLAASMFVFGGAFTGVNGLILNLPIAGITFFAMMSREILKDSEDIEGDTASGAFTLPSKIGVGNSMIIALIFTFLAVIISFFPFYQWGFIYLAGIIPIDVVVLAGALLPVRCKTPECVKASKGALFQKAGMFLSLMVFMISAIFL